MGCPELTHPKHAAVALTLSHYIYFQAGYPLMHIYTGDVWSKIKRPRNQSSIVESKDDLDAANGVAC